MSGQGGLATEVKSEQSLTEARQSAMEIYERKLSSVYQRERPEPQHHQELSELGQRRRR